MNAGISAINKITLEKEGTYAESATYGIKGCRRKRAQDLASLGIETIEDLLKYYPFRYEDIQERQLAEIQDQEKVTIKGIVVSPVVNRFGYKKSRLQFRMMQDHDVFNVSFSISLI